LEVYSAFGEAKIEITPSIKEAKDGKTRFCFSVLPKDPNEHVFEPGGKCFFKALLEHFSKVSLKLLFPWVQG